MLQTKPVDQMTDNELWVHLIEALRSSVDERFAGVAELLNRHSERLKALEERLNSTDIGRQKDLT